MSKVILNDILRERMGFDGIIVTDALEMKSIWDNYAIDDAIAMAINAGVDMLIMPAVRDKAKMEQIDGMLTRAVENT